ncbi:MAG: hypothetical protein AAB152_09315 [Candidatus Coatesbacteria bacterium]
MTRRLAVLALVAAGGGAGVAGSGASAATTVIQLDYAAWKGQAGLPVPVSHHRAIALPKALVVIGGQDRRGILQTGVYRSVPTSKGECGVWVKDAPLPAGLSDHGAVEVGGRIYVVGGLKAGRQSGVATDEIWGAAPATDGRIRAWEPVGRLPEPLQGHAMAAVGNRIYVIGGTAPGGCRTSAWTAEAGGRIPGWKPVTSLPVPLANAAAVAVGDFLIVMGGQSPGSGKTLVMPTVYVGPVGADGGVHTWYLASTKLPGPWLGFGRCQAAGVAWHNTVFCLGGQDPLWFLIDSIAAASFDATRGELGGWGVASGPPDMHQLSAAVVWKDWVYLLGGTVQGVVTDKVLRGSFVASEREDD